MFLLLNDDWISIFLQRVAMACIADTSEEHTARIFKVEVSNVFPYPQNRNVRSVVRIETLCEWRHMKYILVFLQHVALVPILNLSFTIDHLPLSHSSYAFHEYKWFSPNDDLSLFRGQLFGCFVGWLVPYLFHGYRFNPLLRFYYKLWPWGE